MPFNLNDPGNQGNNQAGQQVQNQQSHPLTEEDAAMRRAADAKINGLSEAEIQDPNSIIVTVSDQETPVVILFGARTSGKSMTLIRLTRYLQGLGYKVEPDRIFRTEADAHYQQMCNQFSHLIHSNHAAVGTGVMSFMLVKVISPAGRTLCQILEAPGEHYFDANIPNRPFPAYIENISRSIKNRKTWVFFVEENWGGSQNVRDLYAQKIQQMKKKIKPQDRIIFTCTKVDQTAHLLPDGRPNEDEIFKNLESQYPHIFDPYKNRNPLTRRFSPYSFGFVTFSAGSFTPTNDGKQVYTPGEDYYPEKLWNEIKKNI